MRNLIAFMFIAVTFLGSTTYGLTPSAEPYQCEVLRKVGSDFESVCSGTFLSKTLFLTAGHCFDILDVGPAKTARQSYAVKCGGEKVMKVLAVATHPGFYASSRMKFSPRLVDEISPDSTAAIAQVHYNDISLLVTEPAVISKLPSLPTEESSILYQKNSCRMFGFGMAPEDRFRDNMSLELGNAKDIYDNFCDMNSGNQCYLNVDFNERTSSSVPLMLAMTMPGVKYPRIDHGDSGAGLFCRDATGKEVLAGTITNMGSLNTLNVINKLEFIRHFLMLSANEAIEQAKPVRLEPNFHETLRLAYGFKARLAKDCRNIQPVLRSRYAELFSTCSDCAELSRQNLEAHRTQCAEHRNKRRA
jgi:hypothetical protein